MESLFSSVGLASTARFLNFLGHAWAFAGVTRKMATVCRVVCYLSRTAPLFLCAPHQVHRQKAAVSGRRILLPEGVSDHSRVKAT